ncbi:MAG: 1-acyl-sn-glycerol-3-phosphate acyltransferase, partial [Deltaproteobacteria bacterium]|nr:1-acyl-sn-glycerol-3-phosphate acyltransferase [Deltaproteobacteria bacterium]
NWVLYTLFKHVQFSQDMAKSLKQMHRQGTVVYSIKYRGLLDYLLYHYRFRSSRLPYPKICFDMNVSMFLPLTSLFKLVKFQLLHLLKHGSLPDPFKTGFYKEAIKEGTSALLCLLDPKGFWRHFIYSEKDYIHFLLETQKGMERPIFIVPQLILYKMTPEKDHPNFRDIFFGFKDNPGTIRKIVLFFRYNRKAFIDFGKPLNLKEYLENQPPERPLEGIAAEIKQMLIESIDLQKRVILGPVMKTRQQLKEKVLKDPQVIQAIEKTAVRNNRPLKDIRKLADRDFDEIAADYNSTYVQFFQRALSWLWKQIYEGIDVDMEGLSVVRECARTGSLIYVPSHKSHIDYLVLNYILLEHHMHIPRVAAGQNLTFWPMGHIFRKSGAFFIRRSFKGAGLYSKIFSRYIKQLLEEGHPLEFFIEGGRSRSGKLILPKTGFLSILLQAYEEGYSNDLLFVPASISYDRILEEKSYLKELGGEKKESESFKQVLTARHFLKRKHGKIYINFGQPISLKEYLAQKTVDVNKAPQLLALDLTKSINKITLVTPLSLVASAILNKHRRSFQTHELTATVNILLKFLNQNKIPTATTLNNFEETVDETISILLSRKILNSLEEAEDGEIFYYVNEEKRKALEYYKNSIIHFFVSHSFVAVSLLSGTEDKMTDQDILLNYGFLKNLFKNEFIYDEETDFYNEIERVIRDFLNAGYIVKRNGETAYGLTRMGYEELPVWAAFSKTFIESYWVAVRSYIQMGKDIPKRNDLLKNMSQLGLRYYKIGFIDHVEGVSQINFENALRTIREEISNLKASDVDDSKVQEGLIEFAQKLHNLSHY